MVRSLARRTYKLILALVFLTLLVIGGLAWDIWRYGTMVTITDADAAVVLGAAVIGDRPSPVLVERLRHAQELYDQGTVGTIVVTGGRSPEDDVTEAEASRDWLVGAGVPASDIVLENQSRTTIENLELARPVLADHALNRVLIVSDPLHMRRAMIIAERAGLSAGSSPTPTSRYQSWSTTLPFLAREVWFMLQYLVTGH